MFSTIKPDKRWSDIGLFALVMSIILTVVLSLLDGLMRGYQQAYSLSGRGGSSITPMVVMLSAWVADFRFVFEQGMYAAVIFFVGSKFFETRTIMTIGFDKVDAGKIVLKGPDENNVVRIGHRYGTRIEADAIAVAFEERLKESATG